MKKILIILLLVLTLPAFKGFTLNAKHKIELGINGGLTVLSDSPPFGYHIGEKVTIQSQWSIPWLAMINSFSYENYLSSLPEFNHLLQYTIGGRFLFSPYVFLDLYVGVFTVLNFTFSPMPIVSGISVGFNIPINKTLNYQIIISSESKIAQNHIFATMGLQIDL